MFSLRSKKHLVVSLLSCLFISSCNKEEYYAMISSVEGRDAYCSQAVDQASCEERSDVCQPSFADSIDESAPPQFMACIANPIVDPAPGDGTTTPAPGDGTTTPAPGDGSSTPAPGDGSSTPAPGDGTTTPAPGDGTTTPAPGDGTTTPPPVVVTPPPSIEDTYNANCKNLKSDYLWIKSTMKKDQVVSRVVKVKVCHQTGNLSMHTILIACPALKAHIEHHEDYIGACQ